MITIHLQPHDPTQAVHTLQAQPGQSLMQAAVDANLTGIQADCGGLLTCATCHVVVSGDWLAKLPAMTGDEDGMLAFTAQTREPGSRLSCQIMLTQELDGLLVSLPANQY
ncbi:MULTISPECIES: 2Fe-2S iron-sulfur cluster-binding protein [unclassified Limnohabitans]|uniref:2Fe-2S iron-sulfur cluster-binding protein n=1 Tax=unclassified Limnohabitans TaxID=2626134 RepID=UPI000A8D41E8|nr:MULTISPECIES: 2Fe-2S iron-sulfur cluster-binding protein [unclassified Limnohabitans]PUE13325.1 ferredoxin [Limnohabitans sp. WS1]